MIIAIASQKGGVGKTTTAVSLAHSLALRNRLVLLVDRDQQLNTIDALGLRTLNDSGSVEPGIYETGRNGLHLYPAGNNQVDLIEIAKDYDVVLVDTPPNDFIQKTTLPYADMVIVPAICEVLGLRGAKATLEEIARIAQPPQVWLLPTMYDPRSAEHEQNLEVLTDMPGAEAAPYIPKNGYVPKGQKGGLTIYERNGRGMNLVREKYDVVSEWIEQGLTKDTVTICN